jgi:uncharacterized short protein YbdD (DUF466 family)
MSAQRVTATLGQLAAQARVVCRRVLGVPDYEAYVRHLALVHPGITPLAREQFEHERLDARYSRPGAKCC